MSVNLTWQVANSYVLHLLNGGLMFGESRKKTANNFHCVVFTFSVLHQTRKESMTVKPLSQTWLLTLRREHCSDVFPCSQNIPSLKTTYTHMRTFSYENLITISLPPTRTHTLVTCVAPLPIPLFLLPHGLLHLILPLIWEPPAPLHEETHCAQIIWLFSDVEAFLHKRGRTGFVQKP